VVKLNVPVLPQYGDPFPKPSRALDNRGLASAVRASGAASHLACAIIHENAVHSEGTKGLIPARRLVPARASLERADIRRQGSFGSEQRSDYRSHFTLLSVRIDAQV